MEIGSAGLSDTSILDSSIDSVDSVVQKQIERNKLLIEMATTATDTTVATGGNKTPLGPPKLATLNTLSTDQTQNVSLDDSIDSRGNVTVDILTNKLSGFHVSEPSKPKYLSPADIVQHFNEWNMTRQKDLFEMQKTMRVLVKHVARLEKEPPEEIRKLDAQLQKGEKTSEEAFNSQELGLQIAKEVASYYSTPIELPEEREEPQDWKPIINYKSPREITAATGYFDPSEKGADFTRTCLVLVRYGQSNYFKHSDYMDALFYICKGEAKMTLIEFERSKKTLQNVITHFGSIYAKKRSLVADRKAVENFERQKGEPLEICLQRYDLIVDKIRHLHSDAAWGEVRQGLKRAKLMQIIADDTRAYIQNEEDDAIESTGMPYDFKKLVKMASRYERQHNKLPDENIQTIFDTSSQSSIPRGKKKQREFIEQVVQEVLQVNPLAARATSAERIREASRANRDDSRSSLRQSRFDQNRSLSQDEFFTLSSPNSQNSQNHADAVPAQTALSNLRSQQPYQAQSRSRSPSPRFRQSQSNSSDRRDYSFRPRSRETNSQNRLPSQQSQTFTGLTPAQRSQSSQSQNSQSRPFYNSGMERLRSQNSLFKSGELRSFRERENSQDRNYYSRQNQRERGFSPGRPVYRNSSQDRENSYRYDQNYRSNYDRNRSASRERDQRQLRFRSPSPMYANRQRYNSAQRDHHVISTKSPRDIHIRVYSGEAKVSENSQSPQRRQS
jgi:hypothetical protein